MTLKPPKRNSAPRMGSQLSRHSEIDIPLIVMTAITGIVSWFIAKIMYSILIDTVSRSVLIGLLFAVFCLILTVVVFSYSSITGSFEQLGGINLIVVILAFTILSFIL